jgi:hypothetical protein
MFIIFGEKSPPIGLGIMSRAIPTKSDSFTNKNPRRTTMTRNILEELDQRIDEMIKQDKQTNEHPNATLSDYVGWAVEEIALNK